MTNFEPVYAALFAKLSAVAGIKTASRRLRHWNDVKQAEHPALFQSQNGEAPDNVRGLPAKWRLSCEIYIYAWAATKDAPSIQMNSILNAIRVSLAPDDKVHNTCTLGGLVSHCWIGGEIEVYDGVLGNQAVALIPIQILVA